MTDIPVQSNSENERNTPLSLLERARARDDAAWQRVIALYEPLVRRWCAGAGLQDADSADVRQEVFLAVANGLRTFRKDAAGGSFRGWLRTLTKNKLTDHWRAAQHDARGVGGSEAARQFAQLPGGPPDDLGVPVDDEKRLLYRQALGLMAKDCEAQTWRAFWRVVIDGQRPADVADELSISVNSVYRAKSRVLARLREEFVDLLGD